MNTGGKNIPLRALWGIPAKWSSRVELLPGVVCVDTSMFFPKKSRNSWLPDPSWTSLTNIRLSHLWCCYFALEEVNAKVLERFKYFFHWEETFFWVNLRQLGSLSWSSGQLGAHSDKHRSGCELSAVPHQLFFSELNDVFSPWQLPREWFPSHRHICIFVGSHWSVCWLSLWEHEQMWVWDFLLSFVKILLSLSWVFFNEQFVWSDCGFFFPCGCF